MNNPIFRNYRTRMIYAGVWVLLVAIQTLVLFLFSDLFWGYTLADAVIFNTLFACLIIPLWYPVRFSQSGRALWHSYFLVFSLACVVIFVWILAGYWLMDIFCSSDKIYLNFFYRSLPWRIIIGVLLYAMAILGYFLCIHVEKLKEKSDNELRLNKLVKDGELNLLKSQMNPHFLFNALNSVNSLIIKEPNQAQGMLIALSEYLRYTVLSTHRDFSSLKEEIECIEQYLSIEKLRFGNRLTYGFDIPENYLSSEIPSMLLQPLFENAVKHGVCESTNEVNILIKVSRLSGFLHIEISNDFDPENLSQRKGSKTGLKNIRERLLISYGNLASLLTKIEHTKFIVILKIPVK